MRLFITYAHEDLLIVKGLVEVLTAGEHHAWFDEQLLPGQDWKVELRRRIATSDAYVYAMTKASLSSGVCHCCEFEIPRYSSVV